MNSNNVNGNKSIHEIKRLYFYHTINEFLVPQNTILDGNNPPTLRVVLLNKKQKVH